MEIYIITFTVILLQSSAQSSPILNKTSDVPQDQQNDRQFMLNQHTEALMVVPSLESSHVRPLELEVPPQILDDETEEENDIDNEVILVKPEADDDEMMDTAANMVFRPLFSYRKLQEKRKRLHNSKKPSAPASSSPNAIRRSSYVYYAPPRYVYPYSYYPSASYYNHRGEYYYPY